MPPPAWASDFWEKLIQGKILEAYWATLTALLGEPLVFAMISLVTLAISYLRAGLVGAAAVSTLLGAMMVVAPVPGEVRLVGSTVMLGGALLALYAWIRQR